MTPGIVYARWSPRPNAEDCLSIETQLDRCRNYCKGDEYEIVQESLEPNVSGDDCRPELEKAIEATTSFSRPLFTSAIGLSLQCPSMTRL